MHRVKCFVILQKRSLKYDLYPLSITSSIFMIFPIIQIIGCLSLNKQINPAPIPILVQIRIEIDHMETNEKSTHLTYKRNNTSFQPFQSLENISKKRPSSTKLDLQKMYEESLELSTRYQLLLKQNQQLKQKYQQVQTVKLHRQNLIALVEKIVEEKSKEIHNKPNAHFSWLVFKLNNKIYDLRAKIDAKEAAIREITLSKESEIIRQKQTEIQCINQILQFAKNEGLVKPGFSANDSAELPQIKQIVWMQQQIKQKQTQIIEAEKAYQQEEKEVRKLMQELARKKAELKTIKEMQNEYHRAQQLYKQEKRKKEQRIAGNKTYLEELQNQRNDQAKKLQQLKSRYAAIQQQESKAITDLQAELQQVRKQHEQKIRITQQSTIKLTEQKKPEGRKKEVKRVTFEQVEIVGKNINYTLALNSVSHTQIPSYFTEEQKEEYSIRQVCEKLKQYPFSMQKEAEALLVARYTVQDTGDGYFLQDMQTTQSSSIIKSVLTKIIGQVKVYTREEAEEKRKTVGTVTAKFGKLVQQCLEIKEVGRESQYKKIRQNDKQFVSKDRLQDALENSLASLQSESILHEEIYITLLYLFSYSRDLSQLQVARLFTMKQQGFNWPCQK